jgi:diadenylate cyclase
VETIINYISRVADYNWWEVAIELVLIGLVVYWVVDFLEGTRGERLFRGVFLILIVGVLILNLVVDRFGFERLQYLYKGFLIAVLIIAVAGFQPEIRRVLIRLGQPRFWSSTTHRLTRTVEEIATAVYDLSLRKIGAIIVIERDVALGEFIETGVRVEGKVTAEMLKTIFYPGTALHDMAVIIRGDRVVAARVQLPLAEAGSVDGYELGSRHRAAIGLTRGSDATVVVVSEETGTVSIAQGGQLWRGVSESELRKHLVGHISEGPRPIRSWLRQLTRKKQVTISKEAEED